MERKPIGSAAYRCYSTDYLLQKGACPVPERPSPECPSPSTPVALCPPLRVARLTSRNSTEINITPDADQRAAIAAYLQIEAVRKFRFTGKLQPLGQRDWELRATLGATVVQLCAVTLDPVTTRIDEPVIRRFIADLPQPEGLEIEMPEDDTSEALGAELDLSAVALEALALALPAFPRARDAKLSSSGTLHQAPPGAAPLTESRPNPFAALAEWTGKSPQDNDTPPDREK